jgi:hypothetical protein
VKTAGRSTAAPGPPSVTAGGTLAAGLALLLLVIVPAPPARGAGPDQTIRGATLLLKNPRADDPSRRRLVATARERHSPDVVSGDPTLAGGGGGALLVIGVNGGTPASQTFPLAQGTARSGKPFWRALGSAGFRYDDPEGEQGAVRSLLVKKAGRTFRLKAVVLGTLGPLDLVPPDPGTDAALELAFTGGGRYCVTYGEEATSRNAGGRVWRVKRVKREGCPPLAVGELLALSYNVAGLPEGISGSEPATNTPLISPRLNGYDLVLVQESWQTPDPNPLDPLRTYHEVLVADARHPFTSVPLPAPLQMDPTRPSAIVSDGLNRFSRFPFEDVVRRRWVECNFTAADCLALKGFSVARTTLAPGVSFDVYNLHMEAGGEPDDERLRDEGVTQLATFMDTFSAGEAVIVGGDFNLHTDEEPDATQFQRLLATTGLADVCAALACPQPGRIDKFLFRSSDALTITPLSWRFETDVFMREDGEPLSDHDPLAVRFAWAAAGAEGAPGRFRTP